MPESKVRKGAEQKRKATERRRVAEKRYQKRRLGRMGMDRSWVPWVFVPMLLIGVAWLVVYYLAGDRVPLIKNLGEWNMLIGIGLIGLSFAVATLWK